MKLQNIYVNQLSNPFYTLEEKIFSKTFEAKLLDLVNKFETGNSKQTSFNEKEEIKEDLKE